MSYSLQLPSLAKGIPAKLRPFSGATPTTALARQLFAQRIIPADTPAQAARDPHATAQRALAHWLQGQLGDLKRLDLHVRLSLNPVTDGKGQPIPDQVEVCCRWYSEHTLCEAGRALEALEGMHEGLGQAVLNVLDVVSPHLIPAFTPLDTFGVASYLYWMGEDNEDWTLEEYHESEEEREEARRGMVTRKMLDDAFPAWAIRNPRQRKHLSLAKLRHLAKTTNDLGARRVCELVLALRKIRLDSDCRANRDAAFVGYGPLLFWHEGDVTGRVFDDFMNSAWEGEFEEACGEYAFDLNDKDGLVRWMQIMKPRLAGIRALDALIDTLAAPDWKPAR